MKTKLMLLAAVCAVAIYAQNPVIRQGGSLGTNYITTSVANAGTTGTTLNKLAKLTGAPSTAVITSTSDTAGAIGIVVGGAGTTGSAEIARMGQASCAFDATATVAGDYVQISSTVAGACHDAGSTYPTSGQVLGYVTQTTAGSGTANVLIRPDIQAVSGGSVSSGTTLPATCTTGAQYFLTAQYSGSGFNYYPGVFNCVATNTWASGINATAAGSAAYFPGVGDHPGYAGVAEALPSATNPLYFQFALDGRTLSISSWTVRLGTVSAGNYIGFNLYDKNCNLIGPSTTTGAATSGSNYPAGTLSMTLGPGTYYLAAWASSTTPTFYYIGDSSQTGSNILAAVTTKRLGTGANTASQTGGTITWPSSCGTITASTTAAPLAVALAN